MEEALRYEFEARAERRGRMVRDPDDPYGKGSTHDLVNAHEYLDRLIESGISTYSVNPSQGSTFLSVSIEGTEFLGVVAFGPRLLVKGTGVEQSIALGSPMLWRGVDDWILRGETPEIAHSLSGLSEAGVRALAVTFGLVMYGQGTHMRVRDASAFYSSFAFQHLMRWIGRNTKLARRQPTSAILGDWVAVALLEFREQMEQAGVAAAANENMYLTRGQ